MRHYKYGSILVLSMLLLCVGTYATQAQDRTITGTVTFADDGETLPGVNVLVFGTTIGTTTDVDGQYTLTVPEGARELQFSFLGMETLRVGIPSQTNVLNVELRATVTAMDEVVVTALGISREKRTIGYSTTTLTGESVSLSTHVNPVNALQGRVAGVVIQQSGGGTFGESRMTLRGNATLSANNNPIFVVDGVIYENSVGGGGQWGASNWGNQLNFLNPEEFASVTVLKGAAATALYGSRAINGVVEIETRRGTQRPGIGVSFSQRSHWKTVHDGPAFQHEFGPGTLPGSYNGNFPSGNNWASMVEFPIDSEGRPYYQRNWQLSFGPPMDGQTMVRDLDMHTMVPNDPAPNNFLDLFDQGMYNNSTLRLQGGSESTTFLISGTMMSETGTTPRNDFDRSSVSTRVTHQFNDYISSNIGISYTATRRQNAPSQWFTQAFFTNSIGPRNYDTSKWRHLYQAPDGGIWRTNTHDDPVANVPFHNRWFSLNEHTQQRRDESIRITGSVNFRVTDWFDIDLRGYINNNYQQSETKNLGNGFNNSGGQYRLNHSRREEIDGKVFFNFRGDINQDLNGRITLGGEYYDTQRSNTNTNTNGGLVVPGQFFLNNSRNQVQASASVGGTRQLQSVFGFGTLEFRNQLFLNVTGRNDWTSTMTYADGTGNNSYFYPSISLSWLATETFELPDLFSYVQFRASYAEVGNDYGVYSINDGFRTSGNTRTHDGSNLLQLDHRNNQVPNFNLRPERKKSWEFGTDIRVLNERVGVDFTWYRENTYDQILGLPVPSASGVSSQLINAGNIQNQGIELEISTQPIARRNLRWNVDMNFARNRNMIVDLHESVDRRNLHESASFGNVRIGSVAFVGEEWGELWSDSAPMRDEETGMMLVNWNSSHQAPIPIREGVQRSVGNMNPHFTGGMVSNLFYRGFTLNVRLDAKIGGDVSNYVGRYGAAYGNLESTLKYRDSARGGITYEREGYTFHDGVIPDVMFNEGTTIDGVDVSGMTYQEVVNMDLILPTHAAHWHYWNNSWGTGVINDYVLHENSWIGIQEVSLGYNVPARFANQLLIRNLRISVFGRDLGFLYKTAPDNIHPYSIRNTGSGSSHIWGAVPYVRTLGFNLDIEF